MRVSIYIQILKFIQLLPVFVNVVVLALVIIKTTKYLGV